MRYLPHPAPGSSQAAVDLCPDPSLAQWVVRRLEGLPGLPSRRQPTEGIGSVRRERSERQGVHQALCLSELFEATAVQSATVPKAVWTPAYSTLPCK